eukprot:778203_1
MTGDVLEKTAGEVWNELSTRLTELMVSAGGVLQSGTKEYDESNVLEDLIAEIDQVSREIETSTGLDIESEKIKSVKLKMAKKDLKFAQELMSNAMLKNSGASTDIPA